MNNACLTNYHALEEELTDRRGTSWPEGMQSWKATKEARS